jgi:hypothetical protein
MQYEIDLAIDSASLGKIFAAGQSVTLVKSALVGSAVANGNLPVAWISFQPQQQNNVSWEEDYLIYATQTQLQAGAQIVMSSVTASPVQDQILYQLQSGAFTPILGQGSHGTFDAENQMQSTALMSFGLAQSATINGKQSVSPLNAIPVLYNQEVTFTPIEQVSVFLSSINNNGVVISQVASTALDVILTSQTPKATVTFNSATNTFVLGS